jgi:hypothetical protein
MLKKVFEYIVKFYRNRTQLGRAMQFNILREGISFVFNGEGRQEVHFDFEFNCEHEH